MGAAAGRFGRAIAGNAVYRLGWLVDEAGTETEGRGKGVSWTRIMETGTRMLWMRTFLRKRRRCTTAPTWTL